MQRLLLLLLLTISNLSYSQVKGDHYSCPNLINMQKANPISVIENQKTILNRISRREGVNIVLEGLDELELSHDEFMGKIANLVQVTQEFSVKNDCKVYIANNDIAELVFESQVCFDKFDSMYPNMLVYTAMKTFCELPSDHVVVLYDFLD